jgi:hypothetical protein
VAIRATRIETATTESRIRSAATATGETEMEPECGFSRRPFVSRSGRALRHVPGAKGNGTAP